MSIKNVTIKPNKCIGDRTFISTTTATTLKTTTAAISFDTPILIWH
jgi:hypothetical protein